MSEPAGQPRSETPAKPPDPTRTGPVDTFAQVPDPTRPSADDPPEFAPAQQPGEIGRLGGYRVLRLLGEGGMGAVYAAEDLALQRPVALKTMKPELARKEAARVRFLREARAAAAVESDHIVRIYQVGEDRGVPFIAMEFLRGKPLDAWMRDHAPSVAQLLKIGHETALGLAAAHARGLIHRDIKPANLWLEAPQGRVKILDFGLARSVQEDVQLTGSGVVVGTPAYMAPEQARGVPVDHRCDLFSLGAVLYHLATGRRPFTGADTFAILSSLAMDVPASPHELNPAVSPALSALVMRLLAKRPEDRPQTAQEVAEELRRIHKGEQPAPADAPVIYAPPAVEAATVWEDVAVSGATAETPAAPASRPGAWRSVAIGAGVLMLFVAMAVGAWRVMSGPGEPKPVVEDMPTQVKGPEPKGPGKTPPRKKDDPPADLIPPMTPVRPEKVFTLDHLDAKDIPAEERFPEWQPKELVAVIGSHRQRLWSSASSLGMSPDGKFALGQGRMWDLATLREIEVPQGNVVSPDGKRVAHIDKVWEVADPKKEPVKYPINSTISQFVTNDVVIAWKGDTAIVWRLDPRNPEPLAKFPDCGLAVASPDGKYLAVAPKGEAASVDIYDWTESGPKKRVTLPGPEGKVARDGNRVAIRPSFSATGRLAIVAPDWTVHIWDLVGREPKLLVTIPPQLQTNYTEVALDRSGRRLVRWNEGGFELLAIDGDKPRSLGTGSPRFRDDNFRYVQIAPDGNTIVTWHHNGAVRFWSAVNEVIVERNPLQPQPAAFGLVVSPDGRTMAANAEDQTVTLFDLTGPVPRRLPGVPADLTEVGPTYSPDGRTLAVTNGPAGQSVRLLAIDPPNPCRQIAALGQDSWRASFSPDGKLLLCPEQGGKELVWRDISGASPTERRRHPFTAAGNPYAYGRGMTFTPSGQYLVTTGVAGVTVWAVTEKGLLMRDQVAGQSYLCSAVSPDGKVVARGSNEGLEFFDLKDGKLLTRGGLAGCYWIDFSPDGKSAAVVRGTQIQIIDPADGKVSRVWTLPGTAKQVTYHPDGRHLIVTNSNRTVYILRLAGPQPGP